MADRFDDVHPWWLDRQMAASADDADRSVGDVEQNRTHRDWTLLGTLASPERATVDPRGMVTPRPGGWSLDWWVRAGDRWYLPSRESAVRQRLRDRTPVVETLLGVHEGTLIHRAFAVRASDGSSHLVLEVENRSQAVALALVVRPWGPTGRAEVGEVVVDGPRVVVDGRVGLVLPTAPAATHLADGVDRHLADSLLGADDVEAVRAGREGDASGVRSPVGRAEAAVVVPVPHTRTFRALLPLSAAGATDPSPARGRARRRRDGSTPVVTTPTLPDPVPDADQVVAGWRSQTGRGPRIRFPDPRVGALWETQRRHLLVVHGGDDLTSVPATPFDPTAAVVQLEALTVAGFRDEAAEVLDSWEARQAADGHVGDDERRADGDGAAVVAIADHWRAGGDPELVERQLHAVAAAAHHVERRRRRRRGRGGAPSGLLPAGPQPAWMGGEGVTFRDSWWGLRGLRDAAELLGAFGQAEAADATAQAADELAEALGRATRAASADGVLPAGPGRRPDVAMVAVVDAVLLGALAPDDPSVDATVHALRAGLPTDGGVPGADGPGASPRLTARLGRVELARGEQEGLTRLRWLLDHVTDTGTWPERVHPVTGGGAAGAGHDGVAAADALLLARDLLVRVTEDGLDLCPVLPPEWHGRRWEVHDLVTPHGTFGYAVRWHGDGRPAVLWQLEPHPGAEGRPRPAVRLRASGLDPDWSSTDVAGEALLARVPPPDPDAFEPAPGLGERPPAAPPADLRFPDEAPPAGVTVAVAAPSLRRRGADEGGGR